MGCTVGTCEVANTAIRWVCAPRPAAHVYVSKQLPLKLVAPPNPRQRATGTIASNPASSARRLTSCTSGHVARNVPGALTATQPLFRLAPKTPSFSRLGPYSGLVMRASLPCQALRQEAEQARREEAVVAVRLVDGIPHPEMRRALNDHRAHEEARLLEREHERLGLGPDVRDVVLGAPDDDERAGNA